MSSYSVNLNSTRLRTPPRKTKLTKVNHSNEFSKPRRTATLCTSRTRLNRNFRKTKTSTTFENSKGGIASASNACRKGNDDRSLQELILLLKTKTRKNKFSEKRYCLEILAENDDSTQEEDGCGTKVVEVLREPVDFRTSCSNSDTCLNEFGDADFESKKSSLSKSGKKNNPLDDQNDLIVEKDRRHKFTFKSHQNDAIKKNDFRYRFNMKTQSDDKKIEIDNDSYFYKHDDEVLQLSETALPSLPIVKSSLKKTGNSKAATIKYNRKILRDLPRCLRFKPPRNPSKKISPGEVYHHRANKTTNTTMQTVTSVFAQTSRNEISSDKSSQIDVDLEQENENSNRREYLTMEELVCIDWIDQNLFRVYLNPSTIIVDEKIKEASEISFYTSENSQGWPEAGTSTLNKW